MTKVHSHKWEQLGYAAPFKFVCLIELPSKAVQEHNPMAAQGQWANVHKVCEALGLSGVGSCDICGTGLMNNFVCRDANGKHFVVGSDCVQKLRDTKLVTKVQKAEAERQRRIQLAKAEAKREEARKLFSAELELQRVRNGGLTDIEVIRKAEDDRRKAAADERAAKYSVENAWLVKVIDQQSGDFCIDMTRKLETTALEDFSPRQIDILRDIFAKNHDGRTRRNSKKYETGCDIFDEHTGCEEDKAMIAEALARQQDNPKRWMNGVDYAGKEGFGVPQSIKIADIMEDEDVTISEAIQLFRNRKQG